MGSQPEIEVVLGQCKHQILATRPAVGAKVFGASALQKRISIKTKSSEASKVFIRRKMRTIHVERHTGRLRGRVPELCPHGSLN